MTGKYVIALDQGTTSSRSVLIDHEGRSVDSIQRKFPQIYPQPGWVEQNPQEIIFSQLGSMTDLITSHALEADDIDSIGITNQRETTIVWDRETGRPIANAIVWQCRRTAPIVAELCSDLAICDRIELVTGLHPDAYFSASKIKWLLDNVPGARKLAEDGQLLFGTVDCWLIWNLTGRKVHATDVTNASRTMLYDIHKSCWDKELLELFDIPEHMMPEVRPSASFFGETDYPNIPAGIPICGVAGDQQAALFGQCCFEAGQAKNTYGTGCFLLMNTGETPCVSRHGLVTTIAAGLGGHVTYALEGSVFVGGAVIQWLRDEMRFLSEASDAEYYAQKVDSTGGVYFVPAFTGLGAPYWDMYARGAIVGITRGTKREHIIRAAQESIAYQSMDLVAAMEKDTGVPLRELRVDGGASRDAFLMQFQADMLATPVRRPVIRETTALGAAYLAGLAVGIWHDPDELRRQWRCDVSFLPHMTAEQREKNRRGWAKAVGRSLDWAKEE